MREGPLACKRGEKGCRILFAALGSEGSETMQTLAILVALLSLPAVGTSNATHKVSPGECHCGCCAPVASGEKACTAPVGALHSTTKTDMCRTVYCTDPSDTTGAQNQAWSSFCSGACFPHPEVGSTCFRRRARMRASTCTASEQGRAHSLLPPLDPRGRGDG
ncbi:unnamed protein product [Prorocentrum cordatum]|uniref:Uncharacterized protein n=1 Tax=Prorocentrum cordatum TaxID=2364126 RepID=A0ABN9TZN8_9DINO|nr:unnamed protein product [Polarella glacialis]